VLLINSPLSVHVSYGRTMHVLCHTTKSYDQYHERRSFQPLRHV
ncbi:hypothetical protein L916_00942, partial [Phytophthora nicotianae]